MPTITFVKTNTGLNLLRNGISGAAIPKIKYVALGTSSTAPTVGDLRLGNEIFRKAVTSYTNAANSEVLINMYLAPGEEVGANIQEVALFGGGTATGSPNTGVMIARGLYSHNPKTALESIQIQLDATFS